jgi:hypothetical protein
MQPNKMASLEGYRANFNGREPIGLLTLFEFEVSRDLGWFARGDETATVWLRKVVRRGFAGRQELKHFIFWENNSFEEEK